jgi:hypothetical protein
VSGSRGCTGWPRPATEELHGRRQGHRRVRDLGVVGLAGAVLKPPPPTAERQGGTRQGEGWQGCPVGWVGMEIEENRADEWVPPEGSWYRVEI